MVKWIVLTVVLLALSILAWAVWAVFARLPTLGRAALRMRQRQAQVQELVNNAGLLRQRIKQVQRQAALAQRHQTATDDQMGRDQAL